MFGRRKRAAEPQPEPSKYPRQVRKGCDELAGSDWRISLEEVKEGEFHYDYDAITIVLLREIAVSQRKQLALLEQIANSLAAIDRDTAAGSFTAAILAAQNGGHHDP